MKKWIVFLSISCALIVAIIIFQSDYLLNLIQSVNSIKNLNLPPEITNSMIDNIISQQLSSIVKSAIALFLLVAFLILHIFLLITIAMRKVTPLSVKENLAAWKAHSVEKKTIRKQRKLEKAQAKVAQLQDEMQKDDE